VYEEIFEKGAAAVREAVAINDRYARLVRDALSEGAAWAFDEAYREAVFPGVYRETAGERMVMLALGLEDLTEVQRETLEEIRAEHERRAEAIRADWASAIRTFEDEMELSTLWSGRLGPASAGEFEASLRDLGEASIEKIRGVLTAEQMAELPETGGVDWRDRSLPG
jgi:hypothetical protein